MPEYEFSLIRIFPYKDKIVDPVLIEKKTGQRKTVFWHTFHSDIFVQKSFCKLMLQEKKN